MERAPERVRFALEEQRLNMVRQRRLFLKYGYVCVYLGLSGSGFLRNDDIGSDEIVASQGRR